MDKSEIQPSYSIPMRARIRARWLSLRHGPEKAWNEAALKNDIALAQALSRIQVSAKQLPDRVIMQGVGRASEEVFECMLKAGANPDAKSSNDYCETALHRATVQGRQDKVSLLLKHGADPDALDGNGYTPLAVSLNGFGHAAAHLEARTPNVFLLLESGADPAKWIWNHRESVLTLVPLDHPYLSRKFLKNLIAKGADPGNMVSANPKKGFEKSSREPLLLFRAPEINRIDLLEQFLEFMETHGQGARSRGSHGQPLVHDLLRFWNPASAPGRVWEEQEQAYVDMFEILSGHGHDLKARDSSGNTLWHVWAQTSSSFGWVGRALFDHPDLKGLATAKNDGGQAPLDILEGREDWLKTSPISDAFVAQLRSMHLSRDIPEAPPKVASSPLPARSRL